MKLLLVIAAVPELEIAPPLKFTGPTLGTVLFMKLLLVIVRTPLVVLLIAPPPPDALLPMKLLLVIVAVPELRIAPPPGGASTTPMLVSPLNVNADDELGFPIIEELTSPGPRKNDPPLLITTLSNAADVPKGAKITMRYRTQRWKE
jgi:hypothetical protein